jgi:hypothetical protein
LTFALFEVGIGCWREKNIPGRLPENPTIHAFQAHPIGFGTLFTQADYFRRCNLNL